MRRQRPTIKAFEAMAKLAEDSTEALNVALDAFSLHRQNALRYKWILRHPELIPTLLEDALNSHIDYKMDYEDEDEED